MGIATSLNTQHDGKFVTFTPDPQMKMEFERTKMRTIQRLRLDTIDCTDAANTSRTVLNRLRSAREKGRWHS